MPTRENIVFYAGTERSTFPARMFCRSLEELSRLFFPARYCRKKRYTSPAGAEIYELLLPYCAIRRSSRAWRRRPGADRFPSQARIHSPGWTLAEKSERMEFEGLRFSYETYQNLRPCPLV